VIATAPATTRTISAAVRAARRAPAVRRTNQTVAICTKTTMDPITGDVLWDTASAYVATISASTRP
jgi:hypothetical protein